MDIKFESSADLVAHYKNVSNRLRYAPRPAVVARNLVRPPVPLPAPPIETPPDPREAALLESRQEIADNAVIESKFLPTPEIVRLNFDEIAWIVCKYYGIEKADLFRRGGSNFIRRPRHIFCALVRFHCPHLSFPRIAMLMSGRHHTTAMHGARAGVKLEDYQTLNEVCLNYLERKKVAAEERERQHNFFWAE